MYYIMYKYVPTPLYAGSPETSVHNVKFEFRSRETNRYLTTEKSLS